MWGGGQSAMNVRGMRASRTLGRRVNGQGSRACAHAGRACGTRCDAQCADWPDRGRAPGVRCVGLACASTARVCRRVEYAEPRGPWRGEGALRAFALRAQGAAGCVLTPASPRSGRSGSGSSSCSCSGLDAGSRLRVPGWPPAAHTHQHQDRRSPATTPLQCRPARERDAGWGLGRAGVAYRSCAAVRARSQEPAARSPALARPPARSLFNLK